MLQREIGTMFGVDRATIRQVQLRKNWAWLD
jgi:hypothetical protein